MGALNLTSPARTGAASGGAAVAATDTISRAKLGRRGVLLEIINGNAAADVVGISDASVTPSGGAAAAISKSVANGTSQVFKILPAQADPLTGDVTITHSVTGTVTYKMYPRD
jgi:hypothetical protein